MKTWDAVTEGDLSEEFAAYFGALKALHGAAARFKAACETGGDVRDALDELAARTAAATDARERVNSVERVRACPHEWASMVNEVIVSGEWCPKCGALKP